jgi:gamma-polyglutamate synthase
MLIVTVLLGLVLVILVFEKAVIQRCVDSIPLRIHVNGTRGKSTVTEYIGAGILGAQIDVLTKVTGIIPAFFYNGVEHIIKRTGAPRVHEQVGLIRLASKLKVKGVVMECMSISPELQRIESSVFQPHIYAITNIRNDHFEEMGRTIEELADHICNAIPANCKVVTNEIRFLNKIKDKAALRNSMVIPVSELNLEPEVNLPFGVFTENLCLALAVCNVAGIDHKLAREGILKQIYGTRSPLITIKTEDKEFSFLNAFAANDVDSTKAVMDHWQKKLGYTGKISLIFNTRADRPLRTELFTSWISGMSSTIEHIVITGSHADRAKLSLQRKGVLDEKIHVRKDKYLHDLKSDLLQIAGDRTLVIGIGNIGGSGFKILNELK